MKMPVWGIISILLLGISMHTAQGNRVSHEFPPTGFVSSQLNKMAIDTGTGNIYVGAVNHLYQLNRDLVELQDVVTGPVKDNVRCAPGGSEVSEETCTAPSGQVLDKIDVENVNKILLVDPFQRVLINCGSIYQGTCQIRQLTNISQVTNNNNYFIAPNDARSQAVAFIGQGPAGAEHALYVGSTYPQNADRFMRDTVPVLSTRLLTSSRLFDFVHKDDFAEHVGTFKTLSSHGRSNAPKYVAGFSLDIYNYFVTVQKVEAATESPYISKIVQVCGNDKEYSSYVEMPLECRFPGGKNYNLIQAVTVMVPGQQLASKLNLQANEHILFATFTKSEIPESDVSTTESALCLYKMKDIRAKFVENVQNCYNGRGTLAQNFIEDETECTVYDVSMILTCMFVFWVELSS